MRNSGKTRGGVKRRKWVGRAIGEFAVGKMDDSGSVSGRGGIVREEGS